MARQETTKETKKNNPIVLKKLTANEVKLEIGEHIDGHFLEMKTTDQLDPETGALRPQIKVYFEETIGGNRFFLWGNAGMKTAIEDSCVSKGDKIRLERLEKKALKGGRTKNQYDVFQLGMEN